MATYYVFDTDTLEVVAEITGDPDDCLRVISERFGDTDYFGATVSPAFGMVDGLIEIADCERIEA